MNLLSKEVTEGTASVTQHSPYRDSSERELAERSELTHKTLHTASTVLRKENEPFLKHSAIEVSGQVARDWGELLWFCLEYDLQIKHRDTMQYITPNVSVLGIKWFTIFYACWDWLSKLRLSRSHGSYQLYRLQRDQEKIQWLHKNIDIKQISKITQNFFYFWDSITV